MPKSATVKGKGVAVPSGPPALYEEVLSGPPLVMQLPQPHIWTSGSSTEESASNVRLTEGARWGHRVLLSPNESVLCVVGGTVCKPAEGARATLPLWECASVAASPNITSSVSGVPLSKLAPAAATVAHLWWGGTPLLPTGDSALQHHAEGKDPVWPLFAAWWATWGSAGNSGDEPAVLYADGGWGGTRRLAGITAFPTASGVDSLPAPPHPPASAASRSHHTVTCLQGHLYRFGGETQRGVVAALEEVEGGAVMVDDTLLHADTDTSDLPSTSMMGRGNATTRNSQATPPPVVVQLSPPPPRSSHGACCLNGRFLIIVGGRDVRVQPDDADVAAGGTGNGKNGRAKKSVVSRSPSPGKRTGSPAKDSKGMPAGADAVAPASAVFTTLTDVAVYDGKLSAWLPVRVVGGGATPSARYAAAVAAVPTHTPASPINRNRGPAVDAIQREVLVVGGLDAAGAVCSDAWVLQVVSGADAELAEVPAHVPADKPYATIPVVKVRWIRLDVLHDDAATVFQRHHAAIAVSSQRLVHLVGGLGPHGATAAPCVCSFMLPPLTNASVRAADEAGGGSTGDSTQGRASSTAKNPSGLARSAPTGK